jgi:hypothetical protein
MTNSGIRPWRFLILLIALTTTLSVISAGYANAQRKRKPSRRVTNPVVANPTPTPVPTGNGTDPAIISTANDDAGTNSTGTQSNGDNIFGLPGDPGSLSTKPDSSSTQREKATDKPARVDDDERTLNDMERLSRAEERAENLRSQLNDLDSKKADYEARIEQLNYQLQPENLDQGLQLIGTTRPEDLRAAKRRTLESDKKRIQYQIDLLEKTRVRLESAIASTDLYIQKLKEKVDAAVDPTKVKTESPETTGTSRPPIP